MSELLALRRDCWLWWYKRKGLRVGKGVRLADLPDFGSEPFLISLGSDVTISFNVTFVTHDGGTSVFRNQERYRKVRKYGRITILQNSFIGCGAILLPGITIGPNSVVSAGAIVYSDVPPDTVVWGNPARPLMKVDVYAEQTSLKNFDWDEERYTRDKKAELLRHMPFPEDEVEKIKEPQTLQ